MRWQGQKSFKHQKIRLHEKIFEIIVHFLFFGFFFVNGCWSFPNIGFFLMKSSFKNYKIFLVPLSSAPSSSSSNLIFSFCSLSVRRCFFDSELDFAFSSNSFLRFWLRNFSRSVSICVSWSFFWGRKSFVILRKFL